MLNETIQTIVAVVFIPLITVISKYIVDLIQAAIAKKAGEAKNQKTKEYLAIISDIVSQAVLSTTQTYVSELKAAGTFDQTAHAAAFDKTRKTAMALLTADMKNFIETVYGDLDLWLNTKIEQTLFEWK